MIESLICRIKETAVNNKSFLPNFSTENKSTINSFAKADNALKGAFNEIKEILGGSYKDVFVKGLGDKYEVHHMPADNVNGLKTEDGPAIRMEKADHRETASCGNSKEAREYRAKQGELIQNGDFKGAMQMDIDDIRSKFGDKYDDAIKQAVEYNENREK